MSNWQVRVPKWVFLMPIIVALVVLGAVSWPRSELDVQLTSTELVVHQFFGTSFPLDSITSLKLQDTVPRMRKRFGLNSMTTFAGLFSSDELGGRGHAYIRRGSPPYIVASTTGGFLVINMNEPRETRALYETLRAKAKKVKGQ